MNEQPKISIWFLIGFQLSIYGLLILGASLYSLVYPPENPTVLAELHPGLWLGGFMLILGAFYSIKFRPKS